MGPTRNAKKRPRADEIGSVAAAAVDSDDPRVRLAAFHARMFDDDRTHFASAVAPAPGTEDDSATLAPLRKRSSGAAHTLKRRKAAAIDEQERGGDEDAVPRVALKAAATGKKPAKRAKPTVAPTESTVQSAATTRLVRTPVVAAATVRSRFKAANAASNSPAHKPKRTREEVFVEPPSSSRVVVAQEVVATAASVSFDADADDPLESAMRAVQTQAASRLEQRSRDAGAKHRTKKAPQVVKKALMTEASDTMDGSGGPEVEADETAQEVGDVSTASTVSVRRERTLIAPLSGVQTVKSVLKKKKAKRTKLAKLRLQQPATAEDEEATAGVLPVARPIASMVTKASMVVTEEHTTPLLAAASAETAEAVGPTELEAATQQEASVKTTHKGHTRVSTLTAARAKRAENGTGSSDGPQQPERQRKDKTTGRKKETTSAVATRVDRSVLETAPAAKEASEADDDESDKYDTYDNESDETTLPSHEEIFSRLIDEAARQQWELLEVGRLVKLFAGHWKQKKKKTARFLRRFCPELVNVDFLEGLDVTLRPSQLVKIFEHGSGNDTVLMNKLASAVENGNLSVQDPAFVDCVLTRVQRMATNHEVLAFLAPLFESLSTVRDVSQLIQSVCAHWHVDRTAALVQELLLSAVFDDLDGNQDEILADLPALVGKLDFPSRLDQEDADEHGNLIGLIANEESDLGEESGASADEAEEALGEIGSDDDDDDDDDAVDEDDGGDEGETDSEEERAIRNQHRPKARSRFILDEADEESDGHASDELETEGDNDDEEKEARKRDLVSDDSSSESDSDSDDESWRSKPKKALAFRATAK